ncbi:MAG: AAA family ATPase [Candidatus Pacearchaeota archaeon]
MRNIRSYENEEITFPMGSVLLSGDIGVGKTSILLAIEFALFGLQPGQKGASLLRKDSDEGFVELEIEIEGEKIILKRALKRKKTVSQEYSFVIVNGKSEEKSITEMKNFVLQKLNYPLEFAKRTNMLYRFTVYTPQENMKQIILEDPESRLNTLRHVFGINKYKRIKENNEILISKLREKIRFKQAEVSDLEIMKLKIDERKKILEKIKESIPLIEKSLADILLKKLDKQSEINEIKEKIEEKRKYDNEIEKTTILLGTKKENLLRLQKESYSINEKIKSASYFDNIGFNLLNNEIEKIKNSKDKVSINLNEILLKISLISSKIKELSSLKERISHLKTCPTCLQEVSEKHKKSILSKIENEILNIDLEKANFENERNKYENEFLAISEELKKLENKKLILHEIKIKIQSIEEDKIKKNEIEKQIELLKKDILILEEQIKTLKEMVSSMKKFDASMEIKLNEFNEILSKEKELEINKAKILKEIEIGKIEIEKIEREIFEKDKIKEKIIYLNELENWLSNDFLELISSIEKRVMIKLKNEFSKLFNDWFSILVPDIFNVKLDDSFTPIIEQQDYELDYSYLSGGERTAIALAYRLALNQTINSMLSEIKTKGIVILDEPTEGFSQQQLDKMRDVLKQLDVNQLIIVSHDQKMESFVDHIIKLKKDNLTTKVIS